jgi:hypothetical protein
VPIDNDLGAPGGIATQAHHHVAPLRVDDLKVIVLDIGPLFGPPQLRDLTLAVAPHLPQRGGGASDQHGEDPTKGWILGPMRARDLIFEVVRATFNPENALLPTMRLEPPGQVPGHLPQRLVAQTGIIAFPLAPKGAEAAAGLPQGVVAVDDQAIHAIVIGLDQVLMISGKGIRCFHTADLAQLHRRAKRAARRQERHLSVFIISSPLEIMNTDKLISDPRSEVLR